MGGHQKGLTNGNLHDVDVLAWHADPVAAGGLGRGDGPGPGDPVRDGGLPDGRLLTPEEAAAVLKVHVRTLLEWARVGRIPCQRLSRKCIRFKLNDLLDFNYSGRRS